MYSLKIINISAMCEGYVCVWRWAEQEGGCVWRWAEQEGGCVWRWVEQEGGCVLLLLHMVCASMLMVVIVFMEIVAFASGNPHFTFGAHSFGSTTSWRRGN